MTNYIKAIALILALWLILAYNKGDKVSYNGKHYICTADANVYAPGVYGWEVT